MALRPSTPMSHDRRWFTACEALSLRVRCMAVAVSEQGCSGPKYHVRDVAMSPKSVALAA